MTYKYPYPNVDPESVSVAAVSSTGTYTLASGFTMFYLTLGASCTLALPTAVAGRSLSIGLVQDATGTRTVTWPANVKWQGGSPPSLSTVGGKIDLFALVCLDGTNYFGFLSGKGFS